MFPILFSLGPLTIYTYSFFLMLSFITGTFFVWHYVRLEASDEKILDFILIFTLALIFSGRLAYILINPQIFNFNLLKMLHLFKYPGIFFEWGLLAAFFIGYFYTIYKKINAFSLSDLSMPGLSLAILISDIGCFLGGCSLGVKTESSFGLMMNESLGKRYPVALYQSIFSLLIFIIVYFSFKKFLKIKGRISHKDWSTKQDGVITFLFFILFAFSRVVLGYYYENNNRIFNLSQQQISSLLIFLLALFFLIRYIKQEIILKNKGILLNTLKKLLKLNKQKN